jgi:Trypsin
LSSGGTRKNAQEAFDSLTPAWLHLGVTQDGQPCTGDSGGPSLLGSSDLVAGITVTGFGQCDIPSAPQWDTKLDTAPHRAFLGQYVTLP